MLAAGGYGLLSIDEVPADRLEAFDCGKPLLNNFLLNVALPFHQQRLGLTSVVFHREHLSGPIGYFTLSNDAIRLKESEQFALNLDTEVPIGYFPAVKLCRLAVDKELQGQGAGSAIMDLIRGEVLESASNSAARILMLDAENDPPVLNFYKKHGFETSLFAEGMVKHLSTNKTAATIKMWLDILA